MECVIAYDWQKVEVNHARLRELWAAAETALLVNAHDPQLLDRGLRRGLSHFPPHPEPVGDARPYPGGALRRAASFDGKSRIFGDIAQMGQPRQQAAGEDYQSL
ncbi:hypothetical protein [Nocardia sp. NPDC059691]|uniref:hypothetical protein n=1 Tax=Nocardia sp. NPDC059691 TaxID=3346908 RepID=UPI0036C5E30B